MKAPLLVRFFHPEVGPGVGLQDEQTVYDVSDRWPTIAAWLRSSTGRVEEAIADLRGAGAAAKRKFPANAFAQVPSQGRMHWLPPVDLQEVWAAGVTYERSREARQEEAIDGGDIYARVYEAARPELFFKANGQRVIGPGGDVGIRADARWNVPEPELGLVINPALEIVGMVAGNDMSSRDIEGENPLYLPQAKVYKGSCSLGPGLVLGRIENEWPRLGIELHIERDGHEMFSGKTHTDHMHRRPDELVKYLGRSQEFPDGVVLLTGAGVVPLDDFTLQPGDKITITIDNVGQLENRVKIV